MAPESGEEGSRHNNARGPLKKLSRLAPFTSSVIKDIATGLGWRVLQRSGQF